MRALTKQQEHDILSLDILVEAIELFGDIQIHGDQRGGIYDGPVFGRAHISASLDLVETTSWIHEETFEHLNQLCSDNIRELMGWSREYN